jgi:NAD+ synthase
MPISFAIVQHDFYVGYLSGNPKLIGALFDVASAAGADLTIFSEMAITGYPPEDLVLSRHFQEISMEAVKKLAEKTSESSAILVGGLWREDGKLYNTAFLLEGGRILHKQYKHHLPNYGVFDEKRVFEQGPMPEPVEWRGIKLGLLICEDMWLPDVAAHLKARGAEMLICINASPYEIGKAGRRESVAAARAMETGLPLVYVNQICGQDELVFDGGSFVVETTGHICMRMGAFKEDLAYLHWTKKGDEWKPERGLIQHRPDGLESIYQAMMLGLKDFVKKMGIQALS